MIPCFHKDFWEIKVLVQNKNQIGVCSNKQVLKIQMIHTPKKLEKQPKHHDMTSKLSFSCIDNEKPICVFT
jgi:hypothetical protein